MPYTSSGLEYHTSTKERRLEVTIILSNGQHVWLTEEDLKELLAALRRRKVKR